MENKVNEIKSDGDKTCPSCGAELNEGTGLDRYCNSCSWHS